MKSYFAKLADRATIANVPVSSAVYAPRLSDPFEDRSSQQTQPPPKNSKRNQSAPEPVGPGSRSPIPEPKTERTRPPVETHERTAADPAPEAPTLRPTQPQTKLEREGERTIGEVSRVEPQSLPAPKPDIVAHVDASKVAALVPTDAPELGALAARQSTKEPDTKAQSSDQRIAELEREQAVLLRNADVFMSNLLDAHVQPATKDEAKEREPSPATITKVEREPFNRLEPVQRPAPATAQDSDRPSLVIGKLTVEVTPPTPPSPPPQLPRIVVRSSSRGSGVISARRFGLGQF